MSAPWYKPGNIVRVSVPREHVRGHEQADNPQGPRPWLVISSRFTKKTGLFIAVPLATHGDSSNRLHRPLASDDIDTTDCPEPIPGTGYVLLEQVRALSVDRVPTGQLCGRVRPAPMRAIRETLAALMDGIDR